MISASQSSNNNIKSLFHPNHQNNQQSSEQQLQQHQHLQQQLHDDHKYTTNMIHHDNQHVISQSQSQQHIPNMNLNTSINHPPHPIHPQQHQHQIHHHPQQIHQDENYDLSSLNSKSSRDVPSTIYVHRHQYNKNNMDNDETDAVSNSEDTYLTLCADSIVSEKGTGIGNSNHYHQQQSQQQFSHQQQQQQSREQQQQSQLHLQKQGQSQDIDEEEEDGFVKMSALEETSQSHQADKKSKSKRQKKRRNKKRQQNKNNSHNVQHGNTENNSNLFVQSQKGIEERDHIIIDDDIMKDGDDIIIVKHNNDDVVDDDNNDGIRRRGQDHEVKGGKERKNTSTSSSSTTNANRESNRSYTPSTATATAVSSKATTVHRKVKNHHNKKLQQQQHRHENRYSSSGGTGVDNENQHHHRNHHSNKKHTKQHQSSSSNNNNPKPPSEPFIDKYRRWMTIIKPRIITLSTFILTSTISLSNSLVKSLVSFFPKKERFWFIIPLFCICLDLSFLSISILCSMTGRFVYIVSLMHKLALLELLEVDSASICYTLVCFYPGIIVAFNESMPFEEYWTVFFRWFAVDRWLCRPIKMEETFMNRLKKEEEEKRKKLENMSHTKTNNLSGKGKTNRNDRSIMAMVKSILRKKKKIEESERVSMANHILFILRKITPLILIIEVNVRREGFLMSMSKTERLLLAYGFAVIRSGYLFSPLIWMSWTLQLTIIMFAPASRFWAYLLTLVGLSAIRLSHYTSSIEDMEGIFISFKEEYNYGSGGDGSSDNIITTGPKEKTE